MEKKLRSNEIGAQGCYFIRRLANNLGEPQRSYAINAIDRALTFWKAKRVRKPVPLRAPWLLGPNWTRDLRQLLTFPCSSNPMLQHHIADSFHRDCLHEVPVGYGQLVQPQRSRYQVG